MSMLIIWVGAFFLLLLSFEKIQRKIQQLSLGFTLQSLDRLQSRDFPTLLKGAVFITVLNVSQIKQELWSLQLFNWRVLPRRSAILLLCLSSLGFWLLMLLGYFYLAVNGLILIGLSFLCYMVLQKIPKGQKWQQAKQGTFLLFWLGLFYFSAEIVLRYQSILQTFLGTSELTFLLLDRSLLVLCGLVVVGLIKSWFLPFSGWSVLAALALVPSGVISFAGGLSLVLGELLFRSFSMYGVFRSTNTECRQVAKQGAVVGAAGSIVGWVLVQVLIPLLGWGGFVAGDITQATSNILMAFAILLCARFVSLMTWGHFISPRSSDELQEPQFINLQSLPYCESKAFGSWGHQQLQKRMSEVNYHYLGLKQNPEEKIPQHLLVRLEVEKQNLEKILSSLEKTSE